jgi:hypothetical protein
LEEGTTVEESRTDSSISRARLNLAGIIAALWKYGFGALLVLLIVLGSQAFRATPQAMPAAVTPIQDATLAVSLHSTLSEEVFRKFVRGTGQRMYPRLSREIVDSAIRYSEKYDLSPILVLAIAKTESDFYPFALSKKNARGLMQVNPEANQQLLVQEGIFTDPTDIFDPERNIEAGCFLLRRFVNDSPDFNTALDKYLGADSVPYKAQIHEEMGAFLLLGITEDLNRTSQHKIEPVIKVEARNARR